MDRNGSRAGARMKKCQICYVCGTVSAEVSNVV
jgi:hypothetical protein